MKCCIAGYTRLRGDKSKKTGQPYDFFILGVTYPGEKGYVGSRVKEVVVDPRQVVGIEKLTPPIKAEIAVDFSGRISDVNFT
ncbi:MAG: hypothetical protein K2G88_09525 [Oscillospiraceae bacterium]|nr:hypothetical protein [Oscillospiraceae bacterium]